jgi:hypothetical protein
VSGGPKTRNGGTKKCAASSIRPPSAAACRIKERERKVEARRLIVIASALYGDEKWLKQNLTIKHFFGNSINAVKAQIWVAACVYLLVLIAIKHHCLPVSPQIFLHLIETNIFEKITLDQLVTNTIPSEKNQPHSKQLILL